MMCTPLRTLSDHFEESHNVHLRVLTIGAGSPAASQIRDSSHFPYNDMLILTALFEEPAILNEAYANAFKLSIGVQSFVTLHIYHLNLNTDHEYCILNSFNVSNDYNLQVNTCLVG